MYENIQRNDLSKFIDPVVCIGTCLPILSPPLTSDFYGNLMY